MFFPLYFSVNWYILCSYQKKYFVSFCIVFPLFQDFSNKLYTHIYINLYVYKWNISRNQGFLNQRCKAVLSFSVSIPSLFAQKSLNQCYAGKTEVMNYSLFCFFAIELALHMTLNSIPQICFKEYRIIVLLLSFIFFLLLHLGNKIFLS